MSFELFVSLRHLKAKRAQKFISLNTWISISGVALGVMALIVVIAVMSGFGKDLRDKILGTNSHVVVTNITRSGMDGYEPILKKVMQTEGVKAASPFILNQAMLTFGGNSSGVVVRGVDPDREGMVSDLKKNIIRGEIGMYGCDFVPDWSCLFMPHKFEQESRLFTEVEIQLLCLVTQKDH